MSDTLGPLTFGRKEEQIFLGREIAQRSDYSEDTALRIDQEVKRIVTDVHSRALQILQGNRASLDQMAGELLLREVLDGDQVRRIVSGQPLEDRRPRSLQRRRCPRPRTSARVAASSGRRSCLR